MNYEEKNYNIKNILQYIFLIFIFSNYIFMISYSEKWLAITVASCFFLSLIYFFNIKFAILLIVFFLLPIINFTNYNKINISSDTVARVISITSYNKIGIIDNRKVYLSGNIKDIKLGDKVYLNGEFKRDINISRGIIGEFNVKNFKKLDLDYIAKIYNLRENIFNKLKEKLGYRRASIVTSISFGYSEYLDLEDSEDMKSLGVLHAISVSGLHMALVYTILKKTFGEKLSPILSIIYVIFTGAAVSTIRAYSMMLLNSLALPLRRNYNPINALSLSGILIMLFKPYSIFEVGFQLSFLATLGIIFFNKMINKFLYRFPKYLREGVAICISAQIFTVPVLINSFREFSLGFLFGNLVLSPLISLSVVLGNILALVFKIDFIFNYFSYITYYVTLVMDRLIQKLLVITPPKVYLNEIVSIGYIIMLITIYFYKKGYKRIIYFPSVIIFYFYMLLYNPFPKIEYFKEGVIAISYKGENIVCALKERVDISKYKIITLSSNEYKSFKKIRINNKFMLEKHNNNLILNNEKQSYLIKLYEDKNLDNYDIIDFKSGNYKKLILVGSKVLVSN